MECLLTSKGVHFVLCSGFNSLFFFANFKEMSLKILCITASQILENRFKNAKAL